MTDRIIVYPGAVPFETDLLSAQLGQMVGLGFGLETTLGSATAVMGLACVPTSPASLSITIGRGAITQYTVVDGSPFGDLPASSDPLLKIGINTTSTPLTFVAPTTPGQSQAFLIQAQFSETDAVPVALPYYNAANPAVSFSGPNNSGTPQYTERIQRVLIQIKNGVPASTGSQTAPAADAGWSPLYIVTLANGATTITSGNFVVHPAAPFVPATVPQLGAALRILATTAGLTFNPLDPTQELAALRALFNSQSSYAGSNNGFISFPGGIYHETCTAMVPGGGGLVQTNVTLPTAFPNNCLDASISFVGNTPPTAQGSISVQPLSRTQVAVTTNYSSSVTLGVAIKAWGS